MPRLKEQEIDEPHRCGPGWSSAYQWDWQRHRLPDRERNYDPSTAGKQYMRDLQNKARAEGITVPLTFNEIVIGSTLYITGSALWTPPARETPAAAEIRIV